MLWVVDAEREVCALSKLYPACMKRPEWPLLFISVLCVLASRAVEVEPLARLLVLSPWVCWGDRRAWCLRK